MEFGICVPHYGKAIDVPALLNDVRHAEAMAPIKQQRRTARRLGLPARKAAGPTPKTRLPSTGATRHTGDRGAPTPGWGGPGP
jgi:hypothetical protein